MKKLIYLITIVGLVSCGDSTKTDSNTSNPQASGGQNTSGTTSQNQPTIESYFAAVAPDNNWSLVLNASSDGTFPVKFTTKDGVSASVALLKRAIIEIDKQGNSTATVSSNEQRFLGNVITSDHTEALEISIVSKECVDNAGVKHLASCTISFMEKTYEGCGEYK